MIKTLGYGATKFHKTLKAKTFQRQSAGDATVVSSNVMMYSGVGVGDVRFNNIKCNPYSVSILWGGTYLRTRWGINPFGVALTILLGWH